MPSASSPRHKLLRIIKKRGTDRLTASRLSRVITEMGGSVSRQIIYLLANDKRSGCRFATAEWISKACRREGYLISAEYIVRRAHAVGASRSSGAGRAPSRRADAKQPERRSARRPRPVLSQGQ